MALAEANAKDMDFRILYENHTNVVVADGDITNHTPKNFQKFLDETHFDGFHFILALNSNGGSLLAGMQLGEMIRDWGFQTEVSKYHERARFGGQCFSACGLAFLGGRQRSVPERSTIGFHQFSSKIMNKLSYLDFQQEVKNTEENAQILSALMLNYMLKMGAEIELFNQLSLALPNEMYIPKEDDYLNLSLTTSPAFREFGFEPYKDGVVAFSKSEINLAGREIVYQITTFCQEAIPKILLSAFPNSIENPKYYLDYINLNKPHFMFSSNGQGYQIPFTMLKFHRNSDSLITINLPQNLANEIINFDFGGQLGTPNSLGVIMSFETKMSIEDKQKVRSSFNHCIN